MNTNDSESIASHLGELRRRLLFCLTGMLLGFALSYNWAELLLSKLAYPLGRSLIFISPAEAFLARLKLALMSGLVLSWPIILWQLWGFIRPGLKAPERKWALVFMLGGTGAFWLGIFFAYYLVLPIGLEFLLRTGNLPLQALITVGAYISFVLNLFLGLGLAFTLPLVVVVLARLGVLSAVTLIHFRRLAWVIIFILAAIFTPPDVISQVLVGLPLGGLYELSIILARIFTPPGA